MASLKKKGDLAELKVAADLMERGCALSIPFGEDVSYDLIADYEGRLHRVQVKYAKSDGQVIIGFGFESSFLEVVGGILLLLLFGYAFSWVFAFIGLTSSSPEAAQSLGFILIFPLTFVSSAFVPPETMPGALQWFAEWNPFSITVNAIRALFIGDPAGNSVWGAVAWSVGIAALFAFLAVTKYKRAVVR